MRFIWEVFGKKRRSLNIVKFFMPVKNRKMDRLAAQYLLFMAGLFSRPGVPGRERPECMSWHGFLHGQAVPETTPALPEYAAIFQTRNVFPTCPGILFS
jgi:hypothetical protein